MALMWITPTRGKPRAPLSILFGATFTVAIVQAVEVIERINQILMYRWKFGDSGNWLPATSAGTTATSLFAVGTSLGIALAMIGYRRSSHSRLLWARRVFVVLLASLALFGVLWIVLILSPLVELQSR